ncbi:glycoside hydrolase family 108 protein [Sphingomonas oryzagri]|uniref:Glycosyl hydrolase 108 family protein n=1 Tax=Sphingomonas oryzagri TaxID=3042314 RepID=A0ABT6N7X1_9SPHN|nr:N-acetylmuramidase [Sphingomonas oryzagri]MDH7641190.1 glycosyl hydrolase 108 family protein [Sphingomonas oryzagri]
MNRAQLIDALIAREGGYVNMTADKGGPTRFGVTQAVARAHGYAGDMSQFPMDLARSIYAETYWSAAQLDRISAIAPHVAGELFDTGVNMGIFVAGKFLQRALNVMVGDGLLVDGHVGDKTIASLERYQQARKAQDGEAVLVELLNSFQGTRYAEIVEANAAQRVFVFGQVRNRVMDRSASA